MKKSLLVCFVLIVSVLLLPVVSANAVPYTPAFDDYPGYVPTQDDVDAAANVFFASTYGITIDHMYMYTDGRDTFDGLGVANGFVSEISSWVTGTVNFIDTTNYVDVDWLWVNNVAPTFSVYNSSNVLLDTTTLISGSNGSFSLTGDDISYLTMTGTGGFIAISTLSYDYDGTTDGKNDDLNNPVPEPSTILLLGLGFIGLGAFRKKLKKN